MSLQSAKRVLLVGIRTGVTTLLPHLQGSIVHKEMTPRLAVVVTFLVTFVFLCSGQSVYRPPAGERCAPCNQVLGVGTDEGLKSELDHMKIVVKQLSRKIADWLKDRVSTLEEQLAQERNRVNSIQEGLAHVQNATTQNSKLAGKLKTDLCSVTPKLGRLFHLQSPAGGYKYDLDEARHACAEQGASLASYHQLEEAWQDGLERCSCGWLSDGTARYPTQTSSPACGNRVGINRCGWSTQWNAWCFRRLPVCMFFLYGMMNGNMAPCLAVVVTFLVTFVFLCSGQSVCKPPTEEKCTCNQVVNVGTDEGLKSELDRLKIVVEQLSQKIANFSEDRVSNLEEQLAQERNKVNSIQEGFAHVQNATTQNSELAGKLKTDLCSAIPKLGRLFHVQSPAGEYKYDLYEARHACAEQGASLASYHHLYEAWQDGLERCACGWLSDGTARYPMQEDKLVLF
ncbi:aggrecan core protein-like [Branchiostoma floridae]|uniref:Aggrecan core protein-like n=1 Tax=Branchiostoma floridae TaxID=7739 RepID=A0A9J7HIX1_BRAFL|nr:aggrecan core protein-like [Branchiostoma floridae]